MTLVPLLLMMACDHRPSDGPPSPAPNLVRLAKALGDASLCVTDVVPSGRITDADELRPGAPLCGDGCRHPTPLTTSDQRQAVYASVLFPRVEALKRAIPECGQSPPGTDVVVVLGFATEASDSHVGRAVVSVSASKPYRECNSEVIVTDDPSASLDNAIDMVAADLGGCIARNWQPADHR